MKVKHSQIEKLTITDIPSMDPLCVFIEEYAPGKGKLTIECFGDAWSHYWPGMGEHDLRQFILQADNSYLAGKLVRGPHLVIDWEEVSKRTNVVITNELEAVEFEDEMAAAFGSDWRMDLPQTTSAEFNYVCRIITVIKQVIQAESKEAA